MKKSAIRGSLPGEKTLTSSTTLAVAGVCRVSFYLLSSLFSFLSLSPMRVFSSSLPGLSQGSATEPNNGECHNRRRHRGLIKQFKAHRIWIEPGKNPFFQMRYGPALLWRDNKDTRKKKMMRQARALQSLKLPLGWWSNGYSIILLCRLERKGFDPGKIPPLKEMNFVIPAL